MSVPASAYGVGASVSDVRPKCWRCARVLAWVVTQPWSLQCSRCKAPNSAGDVAAILGSSAA